jgi:type II secretory pathway component PulC
MRLLLCILFVGILLVRNIYAIDAFINVTATYTFNSSIKKAISRTIGTTEYLYILFGDNTIGKFTNQMVPVGSRFTAGSFALQNIDINTNLSATDENSIYGIASGGNQIVILK